MSIPALDHLDSQSLIFLGTIHRVTIAIITAQSNQQQRVGEQYTIEIYGALNESLLLKCYSSFPETIITLAPQSKPHLIPPSYLIVPYSEGGSWLLDCSASDSEEFSMIQDTLTRFIKFENQKVIKSELALDDSSYYNVTQVIAENTFSNQGLNGGKTSDWDGKSGSSNPATEDFITAQANYHGQNLPMTMNETIFYNGLELRKVKLINKTRQCMEVTSEWVARGLVSVGDSIAIYIQGGINPIEENTKTSTNRQLVSSKQRRYFDIVFNLSSIVGNMAGQWISKLLNSTTTPEFHIPPPKNKLGNSALQAATRMLEGSKVAAGRVFSASRQELLQFIERKYGSDALYMSEKIIGSDKRQADVMVYFDGEGFSRRVVIQSPSPSKDKNAQDSSPADYHSEEPEDSSEEKRPERLIFV
ncbi:hypothetical protein BC941DRAFT_509848 [Chlamydoabsidia padenii]|nr:hypothetical protein BC941DRAFT_509848 [Chlamydoabsidia padenii]